MKNLMKGLTILSFIALTACQNGFESKTGSVSVLDAQSGAVTQEFKQAVSETQTNVAKMEVDVEQSLRQMDALFASVQTTINQAPAPSLSGGFNIGSVLGTIGSVILGGFNPISLIMGGINLVTNIVDGFSNSSGGNSSFGNFQATFNSIFGNIQGIVTQAKGIINEQRSMVLSQLATLDPNNPAQAQAYQQLMHIMNQLDSADQKVISKVADFNSRAQSFMNQLYGMGNGNATSFLQSFQGIIVQAVQALLRIL